MKSAPKNKGGRPLKFKTEDELAKKIQRYFRSCWSQKLDMWGNPIFFKDAKGEKTKKRVMIHSKPYTIGGLAVFLDCDRHLIADYKAKGRFSATIKKAHDVIYAYNEERLQSGSNPTGTIFNLKNNYGWKDKTEVDENVSGEVTIVRKGYQ